MSDIDTRIVIQDSVGTEMSWKNRGHSGPVDSNAFHQLLTGFAKKLLLMGLICLPFGVAAMWFNNVDQCSAVSSSLAHQNAPVTTTNKASSSKTKLGLEAYPSTVTQTLATSSCLFSANLERVGIAQSPNATMGESSINSRATNILGHLSPLAIPFGAMAFFSFGLFFTHRGSSHVRKNPAKDDVSIKARIFIVPIVWGLLCLAATSPDKAVEYLNGPDQKASYLTTAFGLSHVALSEKVHHVGEVNAFSSIMYGSDRQAELARDARHVERYLSAKPVTVGEHKKYASLYNVRVLKDGKVGTMQTTASAVKNFALSLNVTSGILTFASRALGAVTLCILMLSTILALIGTGIRPVRARRYLTRWSKANGIASLFMLLVSALLTAVNWISISVMESVTTPESIGVVSGWRVGSFALLVIGLATPWLLFAASYLYGWLVYGWLVKSMAASDDKHARKLGNKLIARSQVKALSGRSRRLIPIVGPRAKAITQYAGGNNVSE